MTRAARPGPAATPAGSRRAYLSRGCRRWAGPLRTVGWWAETMGRRLGRNFGPPWFRPTLRPTSGPQCPPPDVVPAARAGGSPHNFSSGRHRHSHMADQFVHRRPDGVTPVVLTGGKLFVGAFATSASAGTAAPWPKRPPCCGGSPQNFSTIRHGELRVAGQ